MGGQSNIALGRSAAFSLASGDRNTLVGMGAAGILTRVDENIAVGYRAGKSLTSGSRNTFVGGQAFDTANYSTNNAVAIGYGASAMANGHASAADVVAVGKGADASGVNSVAIGPGATVTADNAIVLAIGVDTSVGIGGKPDIKLLWTW